MQHTSNTRRQRANSVLLKDSEDLGEDLLFIEFDVHWNEWLDDYNNEKKDGKDSDKEKYVAVRGHVEKDANSYDENT